MRNHRNHTTNSYSALLLFALLLPPIFAQEKPNHKMFGAPANLALSKEVARKNSLKKLVISNAHKWRKTPFAPFAVEDKDTLEEFRSILFLETVRSVFLPDPGLAPGMLPLYKVEFFFEKGKFTLWLFENSWTSSRFAISGTELYNKKLALKLNEILKKNKKAEMHPDIIEGFKKMEW